MTSLIAPLALFGLALAIMGFFSLRHRRQTTAASSSSGKRVSATGKAPGRAAGTNANPSTTAILVHDINDDRCTGCDACVAVCPTNVLDLVNNKSRVLRFGDCIQCEACMWACPTEALVMYPEGKEPPRLKVPDLDEHYQTKVKGQYLIGEVAGKPLVKNAANLGRAVIEHALAGGLRAGDAPREGGQRHVDVAIVGAGPGGIAAALACIQRGLSYALLDKEHGIASTIARYPKGKFVMAEPYDTVNLSLLPVFDSSKEQLIATWQEVIAGARLRVELGEVVDHIARRGDGWFAVKTGTQALLAQRVIIASGTRGKPRTLGVPGENLPKVHTLLDDPDLFRGRNVLVVGGGDSAVEAAMALADAGALVNISYRGKSFNRAQAKNRQSIEGYAAQGKLKVRFGTNVVELAADSVTLAFADGAQKRYRNDAAFVLIGSDPPVAWLEKFGIHFVEKPHQYSLGKTDELVLRLVPTAAACPETAADAVAQIASHRQRTDVSFVAPLPKPPDQPPATGVRKAWRHATSLFSSAKAPAMPPSGVKHGRAVSLAEFAAQQKRGPHSGRGRRDELDPKERARQLRMLRDEGARLADEESKVFLLPQARGGAVISGLERANAQRRPGPNDEPSIMEPPPPGPAPARSRDEAIAMLGEGLPVDTKATSGRAAPRSAPRPSDAPAKSLDDVDFDLD